MAREASGSSVLWAAVYHNPDHHGCGEMVLDGICPSDVADFVGSARCRCGALLLVTGQQHADTPPMPESMRVSSFRFPTLDRDFSDEDIHGRHGVDPRKV